jgi:flagella basal body P-ring formation protein FlgA
MRVILAAAVIATTVAAVNGRSEDHVREAIAAAVRDRMGAAADVIDELEVDREIEGPVLATPDPGSRLDRAIRFTLRPVANPRGPSRWATALVRVAVLHAHANRHLDRGVEISAADLTASSHVIATGVLRALPTVESAANARSLRPLAEGACITASSIAAMAAVRGGHEVIAITRIGDVEARATVTAAENGDAGSVIRVVNRQTQRPLKARVLSKGIVEIVHD